MKKCESLPFIEKWFCMKDVIIIIPQDDNDDSLKVEHLRIYGMIMNDWEVVCHHSRKTWGVHCRDFVRVLRFQVQAKRLDLNYKPAWLCGKTNNIFSCLVVFVD